MAQLTDLPEELVTRICSYIDDARALAALCKVAKRYTNAAQPFLYQNPTRAFWCRSYGRLALTLYNNQYLRSLVKTFSIESYYFSCPTHASHAHTVCPVQEWDKRAIRQFLTQSKGDFNPPPERQWAPEAYSKEDDAFEVALTELVVSRLENIMDLDLTMGSSEMTELTVFAKIAEKYKTILPRLTSIKLRHHDTESGFDLGTVIPLLAIIPNLKHVNVWMCLRCEIDTQKYQVPQVEALQIEESSLSAHDLRQIAMVFPNITAFAYVAAGCHVEQYMDDPIASRNIPAALMKLAKTLRVLHINQSEWIDAGDDRANGAISSLERFEKLKHLTIWRRDLMLYRDELDDLDEGDDEEGLAEGFFEAAEDGAEDVVQPWMHKLPESLESLAVMGVGVELLEEFRKLVDVADERFPHLKKLTLPPGDWLDLVEGSNIKLEIVKSEQYHWGWPVDLLKDDDRTNQ